MSKLLTGDFRQECLKALSITDVFYRPYPRTRTSIDIEGIHGVVDLEPIHVLGKYTVEYLDGPVTTTMTIIVPGPAADGTIVEFQCTRCKNVHERPAVLLHKEEVFTREHLHETRATIVLSAMESLCDTCVTEVQALESEIRIAHERIHALEQAIRLLEEQTHDKQLLVAKSECRTKDCEVCARRADAEQQARWEAQERDGYDDEDEEDSDY